MRVFVTGASGFLGSAVVPELMAAGHEVLGLVRSEASAEKVKKLGATPIHGTIDDPAFLKATARAVDGVVHLAFNHDDLTKFVESAKAEHAALEALGGALEGSGRPLVVASGVLGLAEPGRLALESDQSKAAMNPRWAGMAAAAALAERGVRVSFVRLSPITHSENDRHGMATMLIASAKANGFAAYVGAGKNRWPAVHQLDAGRLFRLALEKAPAGTAWHAVGEEGIPMREIQELIGRKLNLPVESIAPENAVARFGPFMGLFVGIDSPASNAHTREALGWSPTHPGLLADLDAHYFERCTRE